MKLRIQSNTVRFRLTRPEVQAFAEQGRVSARLEFGSGAALTYALVADDSAGAIQTSFDGSGIRVTIPSADVRNWASNETVGIEQQQTLPSGATLSVLIEKDFQCLHKGEAGKDPDAYPNPGVHS